MISHEKVKQIEKRVLVYEFAKEKVGRALYASEDYGVHSAEFIKYADLLEKVDNAVFSMLREFGIIEQAREYLLMKDLPLIFEVHPVVCRWWVRNMNLSKYGEKVAREGYGGTVRKFRYKDLFNFVKNEFGLAEDGSRIGSAYSRTRIEGIRRRLNMAFNGNFEYLRGDGDFEKLKEILEGRKTRGEILKEAYDLYEKLEQTSRDLYRETVIRNNENNAAELEKKLEKYENQLASLGTFSNNGLTNPFPVPKCLTIYDLVYVLEETSENLRRWLSAGTKEGRKEGLSRYGYKKTSWIFYPLDLKRFIEEELSKGDKGGYKFSEQRVIGAKRRLVKLLTSGLGYFTCQRMGVLDYIEGNENKPWTLNFWRYFDTEGDEFDYLLTENCTSRQADAIKTLFELFENNKEHMRLRSTLGDSKYARAIYGLKNLMRALRNERINLDDFLWAP